MDDLSIKNQIRAYELAIKALTHVYTIHTHLPEETTLEDDVEIKEFISTRIVKDLNKRLKAYQFRAKSLL